MPKKLQPLHPDQLTEPDEITVPYIGSTRQRIVVGQVAKRLKLAYVSRSKVLTMGLLSLVLAASVGLVARPYVHSSTFQKTTASAQPTVSGTHTEQPAAPAQPASPTPQPTNSVKASVKTTPKVAAPVAAPAPAPMLNPVVNTTNCLPPNPSQYATAFSSMTTSQYLKTNSYANTTRLYAALQFAGLLDTVNSKQYVVLAMDDSQWSQFTPAQLRWMNASPANMKSVIGWQVVTSCITWNGVNSVKDMATGATRVVTTLNGPVTYVHGMSGLGTFGSGNVALWDWFTSNGAVTIAGFVNTTAIP